ncbi:MAG: hypothetical protein AABZ63_05245, partial [Actinomycetota bacterium]
MTLIKYEKMLLFVENRNRTLLGTLQPLTGQATASPKNTMHCRLFLFALICRTFSQKLANRLPLSDFTGQGLSTIKKLLFARRAGVI